MHARPGSETRRILVQPKARTDLGGPKGQNGEAAKSVLSQVEGAVVWGFGRAFGSLYA